MSDIKKIKDEFLLRLNENLNLNQINEIKSDLFGKNGLVSSQFKKLGSVAESERKIRYNFTRKTFYPRKDSSSFTSN